MCVKAITSQALGLQEAPRISRDSAHEGGKDVSSMHQPHLPPRIYCWYSFLLEAESTPGSCVAWRFRSIKIPNDLIKNQTCGLLTSSTAPQPSVQLHIPIHTIFIQDIFLRCTKNVVKLFWNVQYKMYSTKCTVQNEHSLHMVTSI
jgi:hypothetical protein